MIALLIIIYLIGVVAAVMLSAYLNAKDEMTWGIPVVFSVLSWLIVGGIVLAIIIEYPLNDLYLWMYNIFKKKQDEQGSSKNS
jgi:fructose-specific phosphotransferase system IIC component